MKIKNVCRLMVPVVVISWAMISLAQNPTGGTKSQAAVTTMKFVVGADCKITIPDMPNATLSDLKPGQKVHIAYDTASGGMTAHRIGLVEANAAASGQPHQGTTKQKSDGQTQASAQPKYERAMGEIVSVDATNQTITINGAAGRGAKNKAPAPAQ